MEVLLFKTVKKIDLLKLFITLQIILKCQAVQAI